MTTERSENTQATLTPEDRELLASVGVKLGVRKPISIWAGQIWLGAVALFSLAFTIALIGRHVFNAILCLALACVFVGLIVAAQKRVPWARWALVGALGLSCGLALKQCAVDPTHENDHGPLKAQIRPEERSGAMAGTALYAILLAVLLARIGWGYPSRRYFSATTPDEDDR